MSKNTLLIDVNVVKDKSPLHKNVDDTLIFPEIKMAQDQRITEAIGSALMNRLLTGIEAENLTADENTLIDVYITDALVQFVLAALPMVTGYQFFTKGVMQRTAENAQVPSLSDMVDISQHYLDRAEWYRERLVKYLQANSSLYPQYASSNCDDDISPAKSGFSTMMWLGDDDDDCC